MGDIRREDACRWREEDGDAAAVLSERSDLYIPEDDVSLQWLSKTLLWTIIAPLDRLKFILQCQNELQRLGTLAKPFRGAWQCARQLVAVEGFRSFWRGNLIQVVSLFPMEIGRAFIELPTRTFVFNTLKQNSVFGYTVAFYAASIAGTFAALMLLYPFEFARFRLAVDIKPFRGATYEYRHTVALFSHPVLRESPHLLYRGIGLHVLGSLVYLSAHNAMHEVVRPFTPPDTPQSGIGTIMTHIGIGLTISMVSTLCLYPIDTVRRRMMIATTEIDLRYPSARQCLRHILRTEGPTGLYRGAAFGLVRTAATSAIYVWGYIFT